MQKKVAGIAVVWRHGPSTYQQKVRALSQWQIINTSMAHAPYPLASSYAPSAGRCRSTSFRASRRRSSGWCRWRRGRWRWRRRWWPAAGRVADDGPSRAGLAGAGATPHHAPTPTTGWWCVTTWRRRRRGGGWSAARGWLVTCAARRGWRGGWRSRVWG